MLFRSKKFLTLAAAFALALAPLSRAATLTIDSLDGDITTNEINSFINYMNAQTPGTSNLGNYMGDGTGGVSVAACGRMYEATQNLTILNIMLKWTDTFLAYRNDLPLGEHRVMWDGKIEPIWPSKATTDAEAGYAGCEMGDTVGHIAYAALLILQTPSIYNRVVPDGNPYGFGVTYKQRALKYIALLDPPMNSYYTRWFITPGTLKFQKPSDSRWATLAGGETCNAFNRQMMFDNAYQTLAMCHDILGDNPPFLAQYKDIVRISVDDFVAHVASSTVSGHTVYSWGYDPSRNPVTQPESTGHGQYDIWGLTRAWQSGYCSTTAAQMTAFADTTEYVIHLGTAQWTQNVDGSSTISNYLYPQYLFLACFNRDLYKQIAQDAINAGGRQSGSAAMTANILWVKHWLFKNNFSGKYTITAKVSSKIVSPQTGSSANGLPIIQTTAAGSPFQKWTLISVGGDYYKIINAHSGKALAIQNADEATGAPAVQWTYSGANQNDEWQLIDLANGSYKILNRNSRKALDVPNASTTSGTTLDQTPFTFLPQQQFQITTSP